MLASIILQRSNWYKNKNLSLQQNKQAPTFKYFLSDYDFIMTPF